MLEAGLLDEILVHVVPVLLGDGVRMYQHRGGANVKLDLIRQVQSQKVMNQWFRVL